MSDAAAPADGRGGAPRSRSKRARLSRGAVFGIWNLLGELGRSRTGLVLVALVAMTFLMGLAIVVVAGYRVSVQFSSLNVYVGPTGSASVPAPAPQERFAARERSGSGQQ